jgi:hypothetical protein
LQTSKNGKKTRKNGEVRAERASGCGNHFEKRQTFLVEQQKKKG